VFRTAWFWTITVPATVFFSLVSIVGGLVRARPALHDWVHRNWSRVELWAAGVRVSVRGMDHVTSERPQIFISNHQSIFDIFAILATIPASVRFVAKRELGRIPIFATAMRAAGHVFIDRGDRRSASRAMRAAGIRMKQQNLSLGLFPEGTRSRDGKLGGFKRGTFALAIETQVPILPVAVDGGWRIVQRSRIVPGQMYLTVGGAVRTEGLTVDDRDTVLADVRGTIRKALEAERADSASSTGSTAGPA
jgi:1-acyl-sn-glycerol-3-phosphate acyltransferase